MGVNGKNLMFKTEDSSFKKSIFLQLTSFIKLILMEFLFYEILFMKVTHESICF